MGVTKAMVNNSVDEMEEVLKQAPRGIRDTWLLEVNVSGEILSPFYWALYDGKSHMAEFMLKDLLAIRADRETYYCGAQNLFKTHPGLIKNLALLSPNLLPILFDGLMWRSRVTDSGSKRVNYFIRDVYGDPTSERYFDPYHTPLAELGRLHFAEHFVHPVTQFIVDLKWSTFVRALFIQGQFYFFVVLVLFMIGYVGFDFDGEKGSTSWDGAYYTRIVLGVINLLILLVLQIPRLVQEVQRKQVAIVQLGSLKIPIPVSLSSALNVARLLVNLLLVVSILTEKEIVGDTMGNDRVRSWCTSIAVCLLWILPFDWFSLDITLASFKLRLAGLLTSLQTGLLFAVCLIVGFGCSLSLSHSGDDGVSSIFDKAGDSIAYLFAVLTGNFVFDGTQFSGQMQFFFILFAVFSVLFLLNLIAAVFTATTYLQNSDVEGMTYLSRAKIIVELESICTLEQRVELWVANKFDERIEFDEGDLGLSGGIQVNEPLGKHAKDDKVDDDDSRVKRVPKYP